MSTPEQRLALLVLLKGLSDPTWRSRRPDVYSRWLELAGMSAERGDAITPQEAETLAKQLERTFELHEDSLNG